MKRSLAILILLAVQGCSEPTPEQRVVLWQEMYMQAARDRNEALTPEAYREAGNRMVRYEWKMNKAYNATVVDPPYDHPAYITIYGDD